MLKAALESTFRRKAPSGRRVLNVGGGSKRVAIPQHYEGWHHVLLDVGPGEDVDIVLDARQLDALPGGSFDAVYCAHNLEHYYAHEVPAVLRGFGHVLASHGFVELRVPDIAALMREAVHRGLDVEEVLYVSRAGPISVHDVLYGYGPEVARGNQYYAHKTAFTSTSLRKRLAEAGFVCVFCLPDLAAFELRVAAFRASPAEEQLRLLQIRR